MRLKTRHKKQLQNNLKQHISSNKFTTASMTQETENRKLSECKPSEENFTTIMT